MCAANKAMCAANEGVCAGIFPYKSMCVHCVQAFFQFARKTTCCVFQIAPCFKNGKNPAHTAHISLLQD
jgi:hypothetical protein